jgi:hypothetical protein
MNAFAGPERVMEAALAQLAALRGEVADLADARARDAARIRAQSAVLRRRTRQAGVAAAHKTVRQQRRGGARSGDQGYQPAPAPRWWRLQGRERAAAVARLRSWVETVFRPSYGHLASQVGPCWDQHDLCLYQLAWLSEMHTVIFCAPERLLTSEADWHTRLLPAAVAVMAEETGRCDHLHRPASPADPGIQDQRRACQLDATWHDASSRPRTTRTGADPRMRAS